MHTYIHIPTDATGRGGGKQGETGGWGHWEEEEAALLKPLDVDKMCGTPCVDSWSRVSNFSQSHRYSDFYLVKKKILTSPLHSDFTEY